MTTLPRAPLGARKLVILNLVLGIGHFLVLFNTGAYLPMIPYAAAALGHAVPFGDWTQANFFMAMAFAFPIAPRLAARFGEVHVVVAAFLAFAAASAVCASTGHFVTFLAARGLQGFAGGVTIPISYSAILRHYRPDQRNIGLILWGIAALMPFTLGPTLGGILIHVFGWRALFVLNVPLAVLVAIFCTVVLFQRETARVAERLDGVGFVLLAIGLIGALWAFDIAEVGDFWRSPRVGTLGLTSLCALALFIAWEWDHPAPFIDLRFFRRRNFAVGGFGLFATALLFQGLMAIYVVQSEVALGYTALWVGFLILPMAIFSKLASILTHRWMTRIDPRWLGSAALSGMAFSCWLVASYNRSASFDALLWPQVLAGVFVGALFPPFAAIALSGLRGPAELRAGSILNLLRVSGQALGIPVFAVLWEVGRTVARHFVSASDGLARLHIAVVTQALARHGMDQAAAAGVIAHAFGKAADLMALGEVFHIATWAFLGLAALCLTAQPVVFAEPDAPLRLGAQELIEP